LCYTDIINAKRVECKQMDVRKLLNTKNKDLFDDIVNTGLKLKAQKSTGQCWGAYIETDQYFIISHAPSKWACASLTHELLHIHLQRISGFKRILSGKSGRFNFDFFKTVCKELDNHFQHIKFYDEFIKRGFLPEEFYCETDLLGEQKLRTILQLSGRSIFNLSINFISLITPGGTLSIEKRNELKNLFYAYENGQYESQLKEIEQIFIDWKNSNSLDHEKYYDRFFKIFDIGQVWLSYDKDPTLGIGFMAG